MSFGASSIRNKSFEGKDQNKFKVNLYFLGYSSGVDFGHILWILNHWDARVSPLVYTLRIWAAHNNVVSAKKPSPFITNFCLVVMIIFFLQTEKILPPLQLLQNMSGEIYEQNSYGVKIFSKSNLLSLLYHIVAFCSLDIILL